MKFSVGALLSATISIHNVAGHVVGRAVTSTSTSAAASSATPVTNNGKRGLAYNEVNLTQPFSLSGQNSQVSWGYNWNYEEPNFDEFNSALEYVPMLWNDNSDVAKIWPTYAQAAIDSGSTALLSFNEPDWCGSGSSCMTVNASVTAYMKSMQPFAGKALLGAPAVTNVGGANYGLGWLEQFLGNCTSCQIDFICIHWYSNKWAGINYFQEQVEAARAIAGGRPIWVTEFGLDDSYTDSDLQTFLQEAMAYMDSQSDVGRYAYFMTTPGMLITSDGSAMSSDGILYNNYTDGAIATSSSVSSSTTVSQSKTSSSSKVTNTSAKSTSAVSSISSTKSSSASVSKPSTTNLASYSGLSTSSSIISSSSVSSTTSSSLSASSTMTSSSSASSITSSSSSASSSKSVSSTTSANYLSFFLPSSSTRSTSTSTSSTTKGSSSASSLSSALKSSSSSTASSSKTMSLFPTSTKVTSTSSSTKSSSTTVKSSSTSTKASSSSTKASSSLTKSSSTSAKSTSTSTKPSSTLSTKSVSIAKAAASATPTFTILSAFYADVNVTTAARTQLLQSSASKIVIDSTNYFALDNNVDPWPGTVKTLSILYTYNGVTRVFVAVAKTGSYTISASSFPSSSLVSGPSIAAPTGSDVDIVAMVWGAEQIGTQSVYNTVYGYAASGKSFEIDTQLFGVDGFVGHYKVGVIWYKAGGVLKALVARGQHYVQF